MKYLSFESHVSQSRSGGRTMDKCECCNGTGKEGGWSELTPCYACDGTGKKIRYEE